MERLKFILFFYVAGFTVIAEVNDRCMESGSGNRGICKIITDCPTAEEQAKDGVQISLCGFHQLVVPIVCCVDPGSVSMNDSMTTNTVNLRISDQKCEEYNKQVTPVVNALSLVANQRPIDLTVSQCNYDSVQLIFGGKPASPGEFPFMAAIGYNISENRWRCGGTLISDRYVLTAAHCIYNIEGGSPATIRLGYLNLLDDEDNSGQDYLVSEIIEHPAYISKYNDIALLKTHKKVRFTKYVRPACLYTKTNIESKVGIATGWGKTEYADYSYDKLLKVALNIYDNQQCYRTYAKSTDLTKGITSNMICAGELKGGKDTCFGDSGGPLLVTRPGKKCSFYVVGVTSFGRHCGQIKTPAIYTRVSEYVAWIEHTIY